MPSQVIIPHFPTVLHRVLADQQLAGSVLTWLPDGESWKVLRWDAFRREVLPQYFSTLRDENGSGCGTIDAFLYHLTAWGFEEVRDGSAVGAYRHDVSIHVCILAGCIAKLNFQPFLFFTVIHSGRSKAQQ